jgi:DNA replication licensing factor MCM6
MSDAVTVRGGEEAEEAIEAGAGGRKRANGNKNRVRIGRDQADVPPVRDETGEKVSEMFQGFLEE